MVKSAKPCLKDEDASYGRGLLARRVRCLNVPYGRLTRSEFRVIIVASVDGAGMDG